MSGLREVDCSGCGRRHTMSAEQARKHRVLRCACGQFVRMDRALAERRSEPAPARVRHELADTHPNTANEQTHLLGSLTAVAALGKQHAPQASVSDAEHKSQPPPRAPMRSISQAPPRYGSEPPTEKPLWYVDLGGIETLEMTIEQLIIARRSGKLGEGALVWRAGMPSWRPVGTLIPAASRPAPALPPASASPPSPPSLPPPPSSPVAPLPEPAPLSLGSYERPLATLEFAFEKPISQARESARPPTPPSREPRSSQPSRALTPMPPRLSNPLPPRAATPIPRPAMWASSTSVVGPLPTLASSSIATAPVTLPPSNPVSTRPLVGERPRWLTASLALLLCIAASGSGAFLVRALRSHRQPLQLSPAPSTVSTPVSSSNAQLSKELEVPPVPVASASPRIVDFTSLSVEHRPPRVAARPAAPPPLPSAAPKSNENDDRDQTDAAPTASSQTPRTSDPPAAFHVNPPTGGTLDAGTTKKVPTPSGDEPGF